MVERALILALLFALVLTLQWSSGAFAGDFGNHPDESAHFVSAVMIHDYLRAGAPAPPVEYAEAYYTHYPKVAVGMWPPAFHTVLAVWMLFFGVSHSSALVLITLLTALLATGVYVVLCAPHGRVFAITAAMLLPGVSLIRANASMVMADMLVAVFAFASVIMLARFLDSGCTRDAVIYGICVTLACLTKANGVAFLLGAPLAVLLSGRFALLRKPGLYWAAAIFIVFGLPWQIHSYLLIKQNLYSPQMSAPEMLRAATAYIRILWNTLGPVLGFVIVLGLGLSLIRRRLGALEIGAVASIIAVIGYHAAVGVDPRYLVTTLPSVFLLLPNGMNAITALLGNHAAVRISAAAILVALFAATVRTPKAASLGYERAAELIRSRAPDAQVMLVSADAVGEGAFVASMAATERRSDVYILRATKVAAEATWYGGNYRLLYNNAREVQQALAGIPVDLIVLDETGPRPFPHQQLMCDAVKAHSGDWELLGRVPGNQVFGSERTIAVYRLKGVPENAERRFKLQMKYILNRNLGVGQ